MNLSRSTLEPIQRIVADTAAPDSLLRAEIRDAMSAGANAEEAMVKPLRACASL